jgi:hypothetical protein
MRAGEWREVIRGHERSGMTIREYCEEQKISPASFYQWRRRLEGERSVMKFALVEPVPGPASGEIELRLATGEALLIRAGAEAATLRMVLSVLREQPQ